MSDSTGFDPNDPEIRALMHRKAEAQTARIVADDERLQREPNFDPFRMLAAARAADPTSILDDEDDYDRIRPAFPPHVLSPTGMRLGVTIPLTQIDPATLRTLLGFSDPPTADPVPGSFAAAIADFSAAIQQVVEQIKDVLVDVGHHFSDLQGRIAKLGILDDGATNRLRHGHASICPKHGPTKGGLCRRCAR